jgi:hypothetical protein
LKKYNPQNRNPLNVFSAACPALRGGIRGLRAICFLALFLPSCFSARERDNREIDGDSGCRIVDSSLARSGWRDGLEMAGKVTIDVKQYRIKGRFRMEAAHDGDLVFEFTGTMAMGGHHEDVVLSYYGGELRILDRERGRYYEGPEVDQLVLDGLGEGWDVADLIRMVTARPPDCMSLSSISKTESRNGSRLDGRLDGDSFRLDFEGPRLTRASWPLIPENGREDRLEIKYEWKKAAGTEKNLLSGLVLYLEGRRWRIKLDG